MLVWLSVWSKVQTTLWSTYKLYDLHAIFLFQIVSFKKYFYVSLSNNFFTVFCGGPLVVEAPGQLPSLPPPLNSALFTAHSLLPCIFYGVDQPPNCPFPWGILAPSNTWFLGPTRVHIPNGISIGSAVFIRLTAVTDRPHYIDSMCMRCGLKMYENSQLIETWVTATKALPSGFSPGEKLAWRW